MATITDFQEWLKSIDDDIENIYNLYETVEGAINIGSFECSQNNGKIFVKAANNDLILMLVSEKAVKTFLNILDNTYGGSFHSVRNQYDFEKATKKDD